MSERISRCARPVQGRQAQMLVRKAPCERVITVRRNTPLEPLAYHLSVVAANAFMMSLPGEAPGSGCTLCSGAWHFRLAVEQPVATP